MKGYKTIAFNFLGMLASVLALLSDYFQVIDLKEYLDPKVALLIMIGVTVGNKLLRMVTTTPVGKPE